MIIRDIGVEDKQAINQAASHPLQAYEWGEFREATGTRVVRKGIFEGKRLSESVQVTIHPIPKLNWNVGYFPKGGMPSEPQLKTLKRIGEENRCVMIKLEPNISSPIIKGAPKVQAWQTINEFLRKKGCRKGRPLFTKHSFQLSLNPDEEELLKRMHHKTRYNIRLAERKGVRVELNNSDESFKLFLRLLFQETLPRQGFYAHTPDYFTKLWQALKPAKMVHLLKASWQKEVLAMFMVLVFNKKIYYPYGASTRKRRELMAPNLLMWETIRLGKKLGCEQLDMWGSLGPKAKKSDSWYGFHRFKQGYGGDLVEFLGSYDLVLLPRLYWPYRAAEELRWVYLRTKAAVRKRRA
jgi:lipid II:glycine glycyltransferase (peptidoglycan interpeptide bridge formation enzyme)